MNTICAGDKVRAKIDITDESGTLRGTFGQHSDDWITVGDTTLIDGINAALVGMLPGGSKHIVIEPDQAFGELEASKLQRVPLSQLPRNIKIGDQFTDSRIQNIHWIITEIHKNFAILDSNHPLAGQKITVGIEIIDVRKEHKGNTV